MRMRSKKYTQSQLRPAPDYLPDVVVPLALPQGLQRPTQLFRYDVRAASRAGAAPRRYNWRVAGCCGHGHCAAGGGAETLRRERVRCVASTVRAKYIGLRLQTTSGQSKNACVINRSRYAQYARCAMHTRGAQPIYALSVLNMHARIYECTKI